MTLADLTVDIVAIIGAIASKRTTVDLAATSFARPRRLQARCREPVVDR